MDGSANGSGHDLRTGRFRAGNTEYRARKRHVADLLAAIISDLGGKKAKLSLLEQAWAEQAAEEMAKARRIRDPALRTRSIRIATALIDRLRAATEKRVQPPNLGAFGL
jgi:hypothetical protein